MRKHIYHFTRAALLLSLILHINYANGQKLHFSDSCLVAYYPFNSNTNDESGHGQHAWADGPTLTTDRFGKPNSAYYFDGNDHIQLWGQAFRYAADTLALSGVSIGAWIKTETKGTNSTIVQVNGHVQYVNQQDTRKSSFMAAFDGNSHNNSPDDCSIEDVTHNKWTWVVATNDNDSTRLYVNGALSRTYPEKLLQRKTGNLTIGNQDNSRWPFTGAIDDVTIYARTLSTAEIEKTYAQEKEDILPDGKPDEKFSAKLYPTISSNGEYTLEITGADLQAHNTSISVYDAIGRLIFATPIPYPESKINLQLDVAQGAYILWLMNGGNQQALRLFRH